MAFAPLGAEWEIEPPSSDPFVRQELVETVYHIVWELSHVFFEHRGLLAGRTERRGHDAGASSFLYPFLSESESDLDGSARRRARLGGDEGARDRGAARADACATAPRRWTAAAAALRAVLRARRNAARARQRRLRDRRDGHRRRPRAAAAGGAGAPRRALDLSADPAIVTAIANDIGPQAVFARQVIAYGGVGDALIAFSTSGDSRSVIDALAEARKRGLVTIALVGYDGGRVAAEGLADHLIVSRSQHIPRIQEAQATASHLLRELVGAERRAAVTAPRGCARGSGRRPGRRLPARSSTGSRARASAASCSTTSAASCSRWTGARAVESFLARLPRESPPLAVVERVDCDRSSRSASATSASSRASRGGDADALVSPDAATCDDCLAELRDPADRRFRYPFINCTNCGPRFTIVRGVPYDRPRTTMAGFAMCARLPARVRRPGRPALPRPAERLPGLRAGCPLLDGAAASPAAAPDDAVAAPRRRLRDGAVLAVKGIGGYHLAVRAADDEARCASCAPASAARTGRSR